MEHEIVSDEDMSNNSSHNFDSLSRSPLQSTPQVKFFEAIKSLPDLGLKLSKTPSFLDKLDKLVQRQNFNGGDQQANSSSGYVTAKPKSKDALQLANKMKAENFPISLLRIGQWQRVSRNEGDLVAKCYFAKRKLVWEFLENGLKSKIEIQWSDILSFKALMQEDQPGILEIELNQPPSFHHEIDPQPRKHTQWKMVQDFTGGQAPTFRRHHLEFPPGALDRPLEKLLTCDSRLFQLSRQGYPTLESPYFQKPTFGIDISFGHVIPEQQQQQQQFSFSNVATHDLSQHFQTYEQSTQKSFNFKDSDSPISVMDFSHIDEHISNQMPLWGQGMNNVRDSLITNQVGGRSFAAASVHQVNSTTSIQNNHMPAAAYRGLEPTPSTSQLHPTLASFQEAERLRSKFQILNELQNMLLNNWQAEFSNGIAEGNLSGEAGHLKNNSSNIVTANYGQNMVDNMVVMSNNFSRSDDRLIYPQVGSWSQPQSQVPHNQTNLLLPSNNSFSSSANSDPNKEYFDPNDWTWKSG